MIDFRRRLSRARRSLSTWGVIALTIAVLGAYAGAIVLLAHSLPGGPGESARNGNLPSSPGPGDSGDTRPATPPRFPASDYRQSRFPRPTGHPLIGANYTHYAFHRCDFAGTGILANYHKPGVAQRVHAQLFQMRKAGVAAIRTIIWHMTDATGQFWGPVSSIGGRLYEPYRTNLIRYLTEIRKFGFARLTVSFAPQQANNPLLPMYKPRKFHENWQFIRTVRSLLKHYGPNDTRIDLLNEGAPSEAPTEWSPVPSQTSNYLRMMYRLYVKRFGNQDVSVSAISWDMANRVRNLVRILKSTDEPMPRWFDVHIGYNPASASYSLQDTDGVLDANGLKQPLVVGETVYDNRGIAQTIKRFLQNSARRIDEVLPWYLRSMRGCQVTPPYRPGAYGRELRAQ